MGWWLMAGWAGRGVWMIWRLSFCGFDGSDVMGRGLRAADCVWCIVASGSWELSVTLCKYLHNTFQRHLQRMTATDRTQFELRHCFNRY